MQPKWDEWCIQIPQEILETAGIKECSEVVIRVVDNQMIIVPVNIVD